MANDNLKCYHFNQYNALSACEHCEGIIRHEPWCMFAAPNVLYAYEIMVDPSKLKIGDALTLHALGVAWDEKEASVSELIPSTCPAIDLMPEMAHLAVADRT